MFLLLPLFMVFTLTTLGPSVPRLRAKLGAKLASLGPGDFFWAAAIAIPNLGDKKCI